MNITYGVAHFRPERAENVRRPRRGTLIAVIFIVINKNKIYE